MGEDASKKPLTDADVIKGGIGGTDDLPGKGEGGSDPAGKGGKKADTPKVVKVGGVEFPAELGDKLNTLVQGFNREIDHLKGQVQTLTVTAIPPKGKKGKEDEDDKDDYDVGVKLFEDPKGALEHVLSKFEKKVQKMISDATQGVEAKTNARSQEAAFWTEFYKDHADLKEHDFIVRAVLQRDFSKLATKTVEEAIQHISDETKRILLRMPRGEGKDGKAADVEGAGQGKGVAGAKKGEAGEDGDKDKGVDSETLSSFIKARKAARRSPHKAS